MTNEQRSTFMRRGSLKLAVAVVISCVTQLIAVATVIIVGPTPLTLGIFTLSTCLLAVVTTLVSQLHSQSGKLED